MLISRDLAHAFDPVAFAAACGVTCDPWQADFLWSPSRRVLQLAARQVGKTTSCAVKAFHVATYEAGETVVIVAPAERQSKEFIRAMMQLHSANDDAIPTTDESVTKIEFANKSRVIALPGGDEGRGIRGIPNVRLAIIDEAAQVSDELLAAVTPMLAVNPRAELVALTTPKGKRGWFYDAWIDNDPLWSRVRVGVEQCPRITQQFLAEQRKILGPTRFAEEFGLQFLDDSTSAFSTAIIDAAFDPEVRPLWR